MNRMAVLQLDSVNVLCRSHYLPMLARLGPYDRRRLDRWLWHSRENFEYLAHEASVTPVRHHRLLRFRMETGRWYSGRRLEREHPGYVRRVRDEVAERGPLQASELEDPGTKTGPWWGLAKGKRALEWLYVTGRLAIHERTPQFVTRYDLPERVIPSEVIAEPTPTRAEAIDELLLTAAAAYGVATVPDLADYFRLPIKEARARVSLLVREGLLESVEVDDWREPAVVHPQARRPRQIACRALLSPFDPVVWFRPRAERLFGFRYRIEIYVPPRKRVHGYYVLPFLIDDRFVARVDLKSDRTTRRLQVRGAYAEDGVDTGRVAAELTGALWELAAWLGLSAVTVGRRGDLASELRRRGV